MSNDLAMYFAKQMLWYAFLIPLPLVLTAVICGFVVSILQAVTQIQDATLSFVPKVLALMLVFVFTGGWMLHTLKTFAENIIQHIPEYIR